MNPTNIVTRILRSAKPSPSQEIRRALDELHQREKQASARIAAIRRGDHIDPDPGPERRRVMLTGDPASLVEMDRELAELRAEVTEILPARQRELMKRLEKAEAAEALEALPDLIAALPKAIKTFEDAKAALERAKTEFMEAGSAVAQARLKAGVEDAPAVPDDLAGRWCDVAGFVETPGTFTFNTARATWFRNLTGHPTPKSGQSLDKRGRPIDKASSDPKPEAPAQRERRPSTYLERGGTIRRD